MTRARNLIAISAVLLGITGAAIADDATEAPVAPIDDDAWTAALLARTDDIAAEVAKVRGLKIKKPIQRDVMEVADMRARLVQRFDEEMTADEITAEQLALERWGLVAAGQDIHALLIDVLTEQIAGFYDPADRTLYIAKRSASDKNGDAWPDMLMAHEIDHALQDQHFSLDKFTDLPASEADAQLARQALVEGDGMALMIELMLARQKLPPPWGMDDAVAMMTGAMEASGGQDALSRAPLVIRDLLMFPYARGLGFVAALRSRHPWKKVDAAFKNPPESTEQILHPELYLAGDRPHKVTHAVPRALAGWRTVQETVWGEAGWSVLLRQHGVPTERAATAAAGWGGDRVVVYGPAAGTLTELSPRGTVGIAVTSWDADIDALEFEESAVEAVEALVAGWIVAETAGRTVWLGIDARVSIVERAGDQVIVVIGAPLAARDKIVADVRKSWKVKKPKK